MELTGKIKLIMDEQRFDSGFYKREFVITTEEQYPQDIKFEVFKEKCELLNDMTEGQPVKVSFDVRGREWQGKYFNNLVAWRIEGANAAAQGGADATSVATPPPSAPAAGPGDFPVADTVDINSTEEDDLPF